MDNQRLVINLLRVLIGKEHNTNFDFRSFINYYKLKEGFTPRQALTLAWRSRVYGLQYKNTPITILVYKAIDRQTLENCEPWKLDTIQQWLSAEQRSRYCHQVFNSI